MNDLTKNKTYSVVAKRSATFLTDWAVRNEDAFEEVMDILKDESPHKWVDVFLKIKLAEAANTPQQKPQTNIDKINVNINKLDTLGDIKDSSWRKADSIQYEEVK